MSRTAARAQRRGSALLASLFAVTFIAGLGAYIVETQSSFARRQGAAIDRKRALYLAEAGLAEAVLAVSQGRSGALGSEERPVGFHQGVYWVESEVMRDGQVTLTSRARIGVGGFTVRLAVLPNVHPVGNVGFFGDEGVLIGDAVIIDGYHSKLGGYAAQLDGAFTFPTTGEGALVRSNGGIAVDDLDTWPSGTLDPYARLVGDLTAELQARLILEDPTSVARMRLSSADLVPRVTNQLGTLKPGPDEVVGTNGNSIILAQEPSARRIALPDVLAPSTRKDMPWPTMVISGVKNLGDVSARARHLIVNEGGELQLRGPAVLHLDRLDVRAGGTLRLDDRGGPIHLHVDDGLHLLAGSLVVSVGFDASNGGTFIYVAPSADPDEDDRVSIECVGVFRGLIHAPGDRVTLPTGLRIFGAAAAKHLSIADGAWLTYDESLRRGGAGMPVLPRQLRWQILAEVVPARRVGFDPLDDLARRGLSPLAPAEAAPEEEVVADYIDDLGVKQTYSGPLTAAKVAAMDRVISLSWLDPDKATYGEPLRPSGMDPDDLIDAHRDQVRAAR